MSPIFLSGSVKGMRAAAAGVLLLFIACDHDDSGDRHLLPGIGGVLRADASVPGRGADGGARPDASDSTDALRSASDATLAPLTCNQIPLWRPDSAYQPSDRVRHGDPLRAYECRPWPDGLWCAGNNYEPAMDSSAWMDAWVDKGPCP